LFLSVCWASKNYFRHPNNDGYRLPMAVMSAAGDERR
jgi:hypothetical protein